MDIPKSHPRYRSLVTRERLADAVAKGITHPTGLIAHGRGEAFDYLLGEETTPLAREAAEAAAARLLLAARPVVSVNGNVAALAPGEVVSLARAIPARLEVNLFHRTPDRVRRIVEHLRTHGATEVLGEDASPRIPRLDHARGLTSAEGIAAADVVLVPLEDGDRAEALKRMGKVVLVIDLNPLSRTAKAADVCVVDELTRALPLVEAAVARLRPRGRATWTTTAESFDAAANRAAVLRLLAERATRPP